MLENKGTNVNSNAESAANLSDAELEKIAGQSKVQRNANDRFRRDPDVQRVMVEIVRQLGQLIEEGGANLAAAKGHPGNAWDAELYGDVIVWQLCEFLCFSRFDRGADDEPLLYAHQVNEAYIRSWYRNLEAQS